MKQLLLICFFLSSFFAFAKDSTFYFTTSDNVRLYVRIAGQGKPCLFVHGGPGSTAYYFEAMPSAKLIEEKVQMIYFDQRGSGRSDSAHNRDYSLNRMVQDMEELRAHLRIRKWAVMGHSFAGILLTQYATTHPGQVASLLYINCTLNMQASMQSHLDFGIKELELKDPDLHNVSLPLNERVWKVHDQLTQRNLWYKLMYRNAYEKQYNDSVTLSAGKFNRDFASNCWNVKDYWLDFTAKTPQIHCPVFVMTGDQDYAIGVFSFSQTDHYTVHWRPCAIPGRATMVC
jgi:proline iminopeptidase